MTTFNKRMPCFALILTLTMALPLTASAQTAHDAAKHSIPMDTMDMSSMPNMTMDAGDDDSSTSKRSPDYSDGLTFGHTGNPMHSPPLLGKLMLDKLEAFHTNDANGQRWDASAWYGSQLNRLWLKSEDERESGTTQNASIEALFSHAVAPFWDAQIGVRHDLATGGEPSRNWASFGIQGLAPYWFDVEANAYVGESDRLAAKLKVSYELLFTQRLILQPELEANFYSKDDPARAIGAGLSSTEFGLRLRYEFRRRFAPYLGIHWIRLSGQTADYVQLADQPTLDRQIVAGLRIWL